jgi:hypothetical protein
MEVETTSGRKKTTTLERAVPQTSTARADSKNVEAVL